MSTTSPPAGTQSATSLPLETCRGRLVEQIVLSTVGVEMGVDHPTRQSILDELPGINVIDRSSMNAWEDKPFREAVKKTGRKRLIIGARYTEI